MDQQYYVGLDLGTKWIYATMIDENKNVIEEAKIPCTEEAVERFFMGIPKVCLNVVMEACGIWYGLYDYLVERCNVIKVANPSQTKLNESGKKTDKWDSLRLAEKHRADEIYEAYVPPKDARDYRAKVRHRLQGSVPPSIYLSTRRWSPHLRRISLQPTESRILHSPHEVQDICHAPLLPYTPLQV